MIITVIIPTYNRGPFLENAVASIIRQGDIAEFDILIVDDASTDNTPEICAQLMDAHPNVRVIRQSNTGVAGARNTGLRNLRPDADIVTFLDSDDIFPPGRFEQDLPHFDDPAVDMTYARLLQVDAIDPSILEPPVDAARINCRLVQLSSGLFRKALIERTGFFAEDMEQAEDTDFLYRIFEEKANWIETDTIAVYYFKHGGNMTNDRETSRKYSAMAMLRSIKRRRDEPWRSTKMPALDAEVLLPTAEPPES